MNSHILIQNIKIHIHDPPTHFVDLKSLRGRPYLMHFFEPLMRYKIKSHHNFFHHDKVSLSY